MNNERIAGTPYSVGAFSLLGTSVVAARYVSNQLGVFTIAAISMAFALLLLIPISFSKLKALRGTISFRQIIPVVIEAFFGMFLFRFLLLNGVSRTSALEAGILTGLGCFTRDRWDSRADRYTIDHTWRSACTGPCQGRLRHQSDAFVRKFVGRRSCS